jgi:hypothetical protein
VDSAVQQGVGTDYSLAQGDGLGKPANMMMSPAVQPTGQFQQGSGKGGRITTPGQGGQPRMGQPNNYSNTVGQWDNASIQPRQTQSGKGKGY